jgi:hypothetical protein
MKTAYAGGSSNIFKRALAASFDNWCASSKIKTLYLRNVGENLIPSLILLISSIPLFEAASISMISTALPLFISRHEGHLLQGSAPFKFWQHRHDVYGQLF